MADNAAEPQDSEAAEAEGQTPVAAEEAAGGRPRLRVPRLVGIGLASFLASGLLALVAGGHFQRPPLNGLRRVPLVGRLIPAPAPPGGEQPPSVPNVAALHPMPATEISELIQALQKARDDHKSREEQLRQEEERLRALQLDLVKERDQLDQRMTSLLEYHGELEALRQQLEADTLVARSEERKRLTQLARIYESQEPATAATELAALDQSAKDGLAVKILATMTEKKAAPIFDAMPPEVARTLKARMFKLRFQADEKKGESS